MKAKTYREIRDVNDARSVMLNVCSPNGLRVKAAKFLRANGGIDDALKARINKINEAREQEAHAYEPGTVCPDCGGIISGIDDLDSASYCVCDEE